VTREVEDGLGGSREADMVRFAVEVLKLVRDMIEGGRTLSEVSLAMDVLKRTKIDVREVGYFV